MNRNLRRAVLSVGAGVLVASLAIANVPVPELSTVKNCVPISPNGNIQYQLTVRGTGGAINASRVNMLFNIVGDSLVCWCNTSPWVAGQPHSFFTNTNASGIATFNLRGGGCIEYGLTAIPGPRDFAGEIFADFVKLQEFGMVSPDAADVAGKLSTDTGGWNPGASCATGLSDAVKHTTPLSNATYAWCTDINCDKAVSLADGLILTPYLAQALSCAGGAGQ